MTAAPRHELEQIGLQALWLALVRTVLRQGPATTHDLAAACGIVGRRYYHRWRAVLIPNYGIERAGMSTGPTGHQNVLWKLRP